MNGTNEINEQLKSESESIRINNLKKLTPLVHFFNQVQKNKTPKRCYLRHQNVGVKEVQALSDFLTSDQCPEGFTLDLYGNRLEKKSAQIISNALMSGRCPKKLTLLLGSNCFNAEAGQLLIHALASENCPEQLTMDLMFNPLGLETAQALSILLYGGGIFPKKLTLNLSYMTQLGLEGERVISTALRAGKYDRTLKLNASVALSKAVQDFLQTPDKKQKIHFDGVYFDYPGTQICVSELQLLETKAQHAREI